MVGGPRKIGVLGFDPLNENSRPRTHFEANLQQLLDREQMLKGHKISPRAYEWGRKLLLDKQLPKKQALLEKVFTKEEIESIKRIAVKVERKSQIEKGFGTNEKLGEFNTGINKLLCKRPQPEQIGLRDLKLKFAMEVLGAERFMPKPNEDHEDYFRRVADCALQKLLGINI